MTAATFHLIVASVGNTVYDAAAVSALMPGHSGIFEVLPHHEPFVTTLRAGEITVRTSLGETKSFPIDGGVLEVSGNRAVVLL